MDNLEWKPALAPNFQQVGSLSQDTGLSPLVASLLIQRGMATAEDVHDFLDPSRAKLHDPFLMKDMDKAVARIMKAIDRKERIMVYGDYDVDGTTSVAMVSSFLQSNLFKQVVKPLTCSLLLIIPGLCKKSKKT